MKTTFNRDGSVTLWNVYTQAWMRVRAGRISDEVLASLPTRERARIVRMQAQDECQ
jgi:hypothetical protein